MPIIHVRAPSVTGQDKEGQEVEVGPPHVLAERGPILEVNVGAASALVEQWRSAGREIPEPVNGPALIDTGASQTCVDDQVAQKLGLPAVDVQHMLSASGETEQNVYPIELDVIGSDFSIDSPRSMGANLSNQGIIALIGRDVLRQTTLHYNGVTGDFTLSL